MENFRIIHPDIQKISEYHPVSRKHPEFFYVQSYLIFEIKYGSKNRKDAVIPNPGKRT
jgi:hypothetical protein